MPGRVRYVIPDYPLPELKLPAGETEKKFLEATWQATRVRAASKEVRELLKTKDSFDLLHFSCHGEADAGQIISACLLLEGTMVGMVAAAAMSCFPCRGRACSMMSYSLVA